ncbi:MAG: hypothetical protein AB8G17_17130 [Gammaproteobacteria bacterium]
MNRWRAALVVAALACIAAKDPLAVDLPELEEMQGMSSTWAAKKMAMNGVPMTIKTFTTPKSAEKVLEFYEREWKQAGLDANRQDFGKYTTVATAQGNYFYSVQVRDASGGVSEGRITVSARVKGSSKDTSFPLPRRSETVSKIDSLDAGKRAESIVAYAPGSAVQNAQWYERELRRQGWAKDPYAKELQSAEKVLVFQRNAELCQLTFVPNQPGHRGKTMLLIHWVKG